jgi:RNA polymerase-associated protein RTF1
MGDKEDRARLEGLSEKERETEIYKRIERRDVMRKRWEIERKLRQAKKAERAKEKNYKPSIKKKLKQKKQESANVATVEDLLIPMETLPSMAKSRPSLPVEKKMDENGIFFFNSARVYNSSEIK